MKLFRFLFGCVVGFKALKGGISPLTATELLELCQISIAFSFLFFFFKSAPLFLRTVNAALQSIVPSLFQGPAHAQGGEQTL